ncbi:MAG: class I SAM-dependent methyltransferase [Magnetospirillum sp.]|nr:class I SAM-dependent methyltransferase [Magnetospirillum sp.]
MDDHEQQAGHGGGDVSYDGRDLEVLADMPRYHRWIVDRFAGYLRGHIIEYGPGCGSISRLLLPYAERLDLVEPSANLTGLLHAKFADQGKVRIHGQMLEQHLVDLPDASVDTFVLVNVLEHVENDVAAMANLFRKLKPGGHAVIFVPAMKFLMSELDRVHGHYRRYHRGELLEMAKRAGFTVRLSQYMDVVGVVTWYLVNTLGGRTDFNPELVRVYDRWIQPVTAAIERVFHPPLGKNVILVAQRPQ